jgi:hypothetical protein
MAMVQTMRKGGDMSDQGLSEEERPPPQDASPKALPWSPPPLQVEPWLRGTLHIGICQFFLALAATAGVALYLAGLGVLLGIPGVLAVLSLVGILAEWKKRRMARLAIQTMQREGSWLYWQLPADLWSAHVRKEARRLTKMTWLLGLMGGFIVALVTVVGPWFSGWEPQPNGGDLRITAPDGRAFALAFGGLFLLIGVIIDLVQAVIHRAVARQGFVALIGPQGAIVGGEFLPISNHAFLRFLGVVITDPPDPVLELHFSEAHVRYNSGTGSLSTSRANRILSLPIPTGWEADALRVREGLGALPSS